MRAGLTAWAGVMFMLPAALATPLPPAAPAPVEVVTDTDYGTTMADPYRWMESGKDPRWMPWLKDQTAHAMVRQVAVGLSKRGTEASVLHLVEVASGKVLATRIPGTDFGAVSWLPDSSGFAYLNNEVRLHRLGQKGPDRTLVSRIKPPMPLQPHEFLILQFSETSPMALLAIGEGRRESQAYITDRADLLAGKARWTRVGGYDAQLEGAGLNGDALWLMSTRDAPNGRIWVTSARQPDLGSARVLAIPGNPVIEGFQSLRDGALVRTIEGGEFGRDWHDGGRGPTKANTWNDAIAVAEALVREKETTPAQMALMGTSDGGVMVGQAVNARPDLFTAAVANVGFMNPLRYVSEQNNADIPEWGGPITDAATFHSAKYAARLAAATSSGKPVLLRIDFGAGHGAGSTRSQLDATWADIYSFVLWRAGDPAFQPPR